MPLIVVAAALIDEDGKCLLQQRPEGKPMAGLWEFPGGKLEDGESAEGALARELTEELGIMVAPDMLLPFTFATGMIGAGEGGQRALVLLLYICRTWTGTPAALESPELRWVRPADMASLPMPPADVPLVEALIALS